MVSKMYKIVRSKDFEEILRRKIVYKNTQRKRLLNKNVQRKIVRNIPVRRRQVPTIFREAKPCI